MGTKVLVYADRTIATRRQRLAERLAREILGWGPSGGGAASLQAGRGDRGGACHCRRSRSCSPTAGTIPGGGVAGDSTVMVEALLQPSRHPGGDRRACGTRSPSPSAARPARAREIALRFGGKAASTSGPPIDATVRVRATTTTSSSPSSRVSCRSALRPPSPSAISTWCSRRPARKPSARPSSPDLGIDLVEKKIVVVKSSNHFLRGLRADCGRDSLSRHRVALTHPIRRRSPTRRCAAHSRRWTRTHGCDRHDRSFCRA